MDVLIVIPARIASTRLLKKMLADIGGKPLIVRTWQSVMAAGFKNVIVACDSEEIATVIQKEGGTAVLTPSELLSGTDRVHAAYKKTYDTEKNYKFIINVQGDMPFVKAEIVTEAIKLIRESKYDISTIAVKLNDELCKQEQIVKPVIAFEDKENAIGKALYFSRSPVPFGGEFYGHIGIYGFRVETLERFVSLPQSRLEKSERLEQLRALENGMTIGVKALDIEYPISVDTNDDLERAKAYFSGGIKK